MIISIFAAVALHGLCWFVARLLTGDSQAVGETQRQISLGLAWMVGAVALWRINLPPSRLHAVFTVLVCALFLVLLGSGAALIKLVMVDGAQPNGRLLQSFGMLSGLMLLAQMALAVPSAILLQGLALTRGSSARPKLP